MAAQSRRANGEAYGRNPERQTAFMSLAHKGLREVPRVSCGVLRALVTGEMEMEPPSIGRHEWEEKYPYCPGFVIALYRNSVAHCPTCGIMPLTGGRPSRPLEGVVEGRQPVRD